MADEHDGHLLRSIRTLLVSGTTGGMSDGELVDRFLSGRDEGGEAAFGALVGRHGPMVLAVCRGVLRDPHEAEDASQATFLVLARKARSIRRRDSLASWLFGVARRVASRARSDAARRRAREREAGGPSMTGHARDDDPRDLAMLHEEVDRLPRKYLDPVVLCYLEGMTYEAAARQLSCPLGTISVRLKRARDRLRSRLARRGLTAPFGPLMQAATRLPVGVRVVPGVASESCLILTQGVLKSMFFTKLRVVGFAGVTICLAAIGTGAIFGGQDPAGGGEAKAVVAPPKGEPSAVAKEEKELRSRLVDLARNRLETARAYYEEGRTGFTVSRVLDAITQMKDAEVLATDTRDAKIAAVATFLELVGEVETRERADLEAGRGTLPDVAEASLRRAQAEMELRRARSPSGPVDLESLDRRLGDVERKLDLILRSLPTSPPSTPRK